MVGENIKKIREQHNYSQTEFAKLIGVSKQTLYKYEHGIITNVPSDKIEKISKLCSVSPARIMGWDEISDYMLEVNVDKLVDAVQSGMNDSTTQAEQEKQILFFADLIRAYRTAPEHIQQAICMMLGIDRINNR